MILAWILSDSQIQTQPEVILTSSSAPLQVHSANLKPSVKIDPFSRHSLLEPAAAPPVKKA